jgi:hypothetical protein
MSNDSRTAKQNLLKLLANAASYNDKGAEWSGHNAEQVAATQREYQRAQLELAKLLGEHALGDELGSAIESGAAARDWSGRYASLAEELFGVRCDGPQS